MLLLRPLCCIPHLQICQNLRNNLQHPNEFIRGVTLRFLCRIREEEILEPLIPSILGNLEHRHSYVRRNAVLAVNAIYKLPKGELLLQVIIHGVSQQWQQQQQQQASGFFHWGGGMVLDSQHATAQLLVVSVSMQKGHAAAVQLA
jgi:hypothetical protein